MAQKRMLDKKISVSEQVSNMPVEAQVVFSWGIPHADDVGLLPRSHKTLRAMLVPMWNIQPEDFDKLVAAIVKEALWEEVEYGGAKFYLIKKFKEHQTLKKDRQPQTLISMAFDKDPKVSWDTLSSILESLGIHLEDTDFQLDTEEKGREGKRREVSSSSARADAPYSDAFEEFWKAYPRKVGQGNAWKSWQKLKVSKTLSEKIVASVVEHAEKDSQWIKDDGQFIPHPATFLNQRRFEDEIRAGKARKSDAF